VAVGSVGVPAARMKNGPAVPEFTLPLFSTAHRWKAEKDKRKGDSRPSVALRRRFVRDWAGVHLGAMEAPITTGDGHQGRQPRASDDRIRSTLFSKPPGSYEALLNI